MNSPTSMDTPNLPLPDEGDALRSARAGFGAMAGAYFLGTFNDNLFKQAVMLLAVAAGAKSLQGLVVVAFVLPFVVLAAPAGWAADRFPKRRIVRLAKGVEALGALAGALGVITGSLWLMVAMVGLMGLQSAFFSPALNGAIPELYPASYVTRANALLRMLVTIGILVGTACAGPILDLKGHGWGGSSLGPTVLGMVIVGIGLVGIGVSLLVPGRPAADPGRPFPWTGPVDTVRELVEAYRDRLLGTVITADVFIWALGSLQLLVINPLGLVQYHLTNTATSGLVAAQMLGIGLGGLVAAQVAKGERWHRILVPAGLGMAVCMGTLALVPLLPSAWQVPCLFPLLALTGATGGMILIPCESFIQVRPPAARKGAVWASANCFSFAGIAVAGGVSSLLLKFLMPTQVFGVLAGATALYALLLGRGLSREVA